MPKPFELDVENIPRQLPWKLSRSVQGIVSINMIHVAKWTCTKALFKRAGKLIKGGQFFLYSPFKICNKYTSKSNYYFDNS